MRGVAAELGGESPCRITAPGGTRKVGYLSRAPADMLRNLRMVTAAIWARIGWSRAKHGKRSVAELLDTARKLTDIQFVAFLLLFEDLLNDIIRPFTKQAQAKLEPSAAHAAADHALHALVCFGRSLVKCRSLLRVLVLLRQHAPHADLMNMLAAFGRLAWLRRLHSFLAAAPDLLKEAPTFNGVMLLVPAEPMDSSQSMLLGPHCQCKRKEEKHEATWASAACSADGRPVPDRRRGPRDPVRLRRCPNMDVLDAPPRTMILERVRPKRPSFSYARMYRRGIEPFETSTGNWTSARCQMPSALYDVANLIDAAFVSGESLIQYMIAELTDMLTLVGCNQGMSSLLRAVAVCWDWATLIFERPSARHSRALFDCVEQLLPFLRSSEWPAGSDFNHVLRSWDIPLSKWRQQYLIFLGRVRAAYACSRGAAVVGVPPDVQSAAVSWVQSVTFDLRPVWIRPLLFSLLRQRLRRADWTTLQLSMLLSEALGGESPEPWTNVARSAFCVPRGFQLRGVFRVRTAPPVRGPSFRAGDFVCCKSRRHPDFKKILLISAVYPVVDVSAVGATLDRYRWFSSGSAQDWQTLGVRRRLPQRAFEAWHCARLHHRCRLLCIPEAPCEGAGSIMRLQYDPRQTADAAEVAARLSLAAARVRCIGGERDEAIVRRTAELLSATQRRQVNPCAAPRTSHDVAQDEASYLKNMGLHSGGESPFFASMTPKALKSVVKNPSAKRRRSLMRSLRRDFLPRNLPPEMSEALHAAVRGGKVPVFPPSIDVLRGKDKGVTHSVGLQKSLHWFRSSEGKAWKADRAKLFSADAPSDDEAGGKKQKLV